MQKKKVSNAELLHYGELVKRNSFETIRGYYTIRIIKYKNSLYFHKMKNGQVVEIKKLS